MLESFNDPMVKNVFNSLLMTISVLLVAVTAILIWLAKKQMSKTEDNTRRIAVIEVELVDRDEHKADLNLVWEKIDEMNEKIGDTAGVFIGEHTITRNAFEKMYTDILREVSKLNEK